MRKVEPISRMYPSLDSGCRRDAPKLTMERVLDTIKEIDPSFVVDLSKKDIPSFLYNSSGKLTKG